MRIWGNKFCKAFVLNVTVPYVHVPSVTGLSVTEALGGRFLPRAFVLIGGIPPWSACGMGSRCSPGCERSWYPYCFVCCFVEFSKSNSSELILCF